MNKVLSRLLIVCFCLNFTGCAVFMSDASTAIIERTVPANFKLNEVRKIVWKGNSKLELHYSARRGDPPPKQLKDYITQHLSVLETATPYKLRAALQKKGGAQGESYDISLEPASAIDYRGPYTIYVVMNILDKNGRSVWRSVTPATTSNFFYRSGMPNEDFVDNYVEAIMKILLKAELISETKP